MDVVVNTALFVSFTEVDSIVYGSGVELVCVPEIMEEIFGWLPISQLYSSCRLVCRRWNNIICRQKVYSPPHIHILYLIIHLFSPRCTCSGGLRYLYMWICMETSCILVYKLLQHEVQGLNVNCLTSNTLCTRFNHDIVYYTYAMCLCLSMGSVMLVQTCIFSRKVRQISVAIFHSFKCHGVIV